MWVGHFAAQTAAGVLLHRRTWRRSHSVVKDPRWGWNMPTLVGQWDLSFRNNMRSIRYTGWIAESRLSRTALTLLLETGLEINKQFNWQFYCVKQGNNENHVSLTFERYWGWIVTTVMYRIQTQDIVNSLYVCLCLLNPHDASKSPLMNMYSHSHSYN